MKIKTILYVLSLALYQNFGSSYAQCPPGNLTLSTQAEVDAFPTDYPGCTSINGRLIIEGNGIHDLSPLSSLTVIANELIIYDNNSLVNLNGLHNLNSVRGVYIINLSALTSLMAFSGLTSTVALNIEDCPQLTDLMGLHNIASATGTVQIKKNPQLINLTGLTNLTSVSSIMIIRDNDAMVNLQGIPNLSTLNILTVDQNDLLTSFTGLNVTSIPSGISIEANGSLTNLSSLSFLSSIGRYINLRNNPVLTDLSGLSGVAMNLSSYLRIENNDQLQTLSGLEGVSATYGGLEILDNDILNDISSLSNISEIQTEFRIQNNPVLADISALENVNFLPMYQPFGCSFVVTNNPLLDFCSIQSICDFISDPANLYCFSGNNSNCDSNFDVEGGCGLLPVNLLSFQGESNQSEIYLEWKASDQINNQGWEIHKRRDDKVWTTLDFIKGELNDAALKRYNFTDHNPSPGINYYRLKQIDYDGNYEYSDVISVYFDESEDLNIYPNPVQSQLNISGVEIENISRLHIHDISGRLVLQASHQSSIDVSSLEAGVYFLKLGDQTRSFIKY